MNKGHITSSLFVKHPVIDFYLDGFERRIDNREKFIIVLINNVFKLFYIILLIKYSLNLFNEFDYEINLYSFDLSLLYGGIYEFNNIFVLLSLTFGISLNLKYRHSKDPVNLVWIELFNFIRGKNRLPEKRLTFRNLDHQDMSKLIRLSRISYNFFGFIYSILRKYKSSRLNHAKVSCYYILLSFNSSNSDIFYLPGI